MMKASVRRLCISVISIFIALNCKGQQSKNLTISVEPYKRLTYDAFFKQLALKSPDCHVEYLEGFNFEWGVRYKLKVKEKHLANPPEDGSSIVYDLKKVISAESVPIDYIFKLRLERDLYLGPGDQVNNFKQLNDSVYLYMDEIELEIPKALRPEFDEILKVNESKKGSFKFLSNHRIRLLEFLKW